MPFFFSWGCVLDELFAGGEAALDAGVPADAADGLTVVFGAYQDLAGGGGAAVGAPGILMMVRAAYTSFARWCFIHARWGMRNPLGCQGSSDAGGDVDAGGGCCR